MPSIDHVLHHAPQDLLTVFGAGIGLAAAAIGVLRLVSTTRRSDFGVGRFVASARSWLNGRRFKG
jgi:hypothetical protein